jgi:hypothetical protein
MSESTDWRLTNTGAVYYLYSTFANFDSLARLARNKDQQTKS